LILRGPQSCAATSIIAIEVDIFRHSFFPNIFLINSFLKILSNVSNNNSTLPACTQGMKPRHFVFCLKQRMKIWWKFSVFDVDLRSPETRHSNIFSTFQEMWRISVNRGKISVSILFPVIHLVCYRHCYLLLSEVNIMDNVVAFRRWEMLLSEHNSDTEFTEHASSSGLSLSLLSLSSRWLTARFRLDRFQKLTYLTRNLLIRK